jgi:hypothetical protein
MFALNQLWRSAAVDRKNPDLRVAKVGPAQIAKSAQIREHDVLAVLESEKVKGTLEYGKNSVRFFSMPSVIQ